MRIPSLLAFGLVAGLAACGTNVADRAVTGGAIGAAAGGAGAAILDGDVTSGVIIGGLVGAATGAATDARDIDLGDPIYKQ